MEPGRRLFPGIALWTRQFRPEIHERLFLALLGGFRFGGLVRFFVLCALLVFILFCDGFLFVGAWSFNLDLRVVGQSVTTRTDDGLSGIHTACDLRKLLVV